MYVFLAVVSVINIISITIGFYPVDFEEIRHDDDDTSKPNHGELTKLAILNKVTLIGATYILIYVGVEVTLGGWGFTWLTEGRHGEAGSMLQVMSGYWGGLAMGRILLGYLSGRFGEKLMITLFTMMIIGGLVIMMLSTDIVIDSAGNFYFIFRCNIWVSLTHTHTYSFHYYWVTIRSHVSYHYFLSFKGLT